MDDDDIAELRRLSGKYATARLRLGGSGVLLDDSRGIVICKMNLDDLPLEEALFYARMFSMAGEMMWEVLSQSTPPNEEPATA